MFKDAKDNGTFNPNYEHRLNKDGSNNPKYVDVLDEDKPLSGQKFACVSFISPEKIIKSRDTYNFSKYLKNWELRKSMEKYNQFLSFLAFKYTLDFDTLSKDLQEFVAEERNNLFLTSIDDDYKTFLDMNETQLDEDFNIDHKFETSVRGLKIRGSYPSQQEAELRCKMLREVDPNHDVFVGPVGMWMPFHPEAYKTGRVEYLEDELNKLMQEKQNNEQNAKVEFDKRVKESKEKAMEDNKKKAQASGNVLTQTLNSAGQLVSVKDMNTTEMNLLRNAELQSQEEKTQEDSSTILLSDIKKELFESENVVIDYKNSDHGLSRLTK
jgi:hypothetical protein